MSMTARHDVRTFTARLGSKAAAMTWRASRLADAGSLARHVAVPCHGARHFARHRPCLRRIRQDTTE
jgi:hypothetical protein